MPIPYNSSSIHSEEVKSLLEQRAQKANLHGGYRSSNAYTDAPDTPSVYTQFSPKSVYTQFLGSPGPPVPINSALDVKHQYTAYSDETATPPSRFLVPVADAGHLHHSTPDLSVVSSDEDHTLSRNISILGPKMKIHSPAPWETEFDEGADSQDEDDRISIDRRSIFSARKRGKSEERSESARKGFSFKNVSPRVRRDRKQSGGLEADAARDEAFANMPKRSLYQTTSSSAVCLAVPPISNGSVRRPDGLLRCRTASQPSQRASNIAPIPDQPLINRNTSMYSSKSQEADFLDDSSEKEYHPFADPDNFRSANRVSDATGQYSSLISAMSIPAVETIQEGGAEKQYPDTQQARQSTSQHRTTIDSANYEPEWPSVSKDTRLVHGQTMQIPTAGVKSTNSFDTRSIAGQSSASQTRESSNATVVTNTALATPARSLKQKKSGLLRLFNKDKERKSSEAPYTPVSPGFMQSKFQPSSPSDDAVSYKSSKLALPPSSSKPKSQRQHPLRPPPLRSITTPPRTYERHEDRDSLRVQNSSTSIGDAKSAPAISTGFPALDIRPMSMLFSDHFQDKLLIEPLGSELSTIAKSSQSSLVSTPPIVTPLTSPLPLTPSSRTSSSKRQMPLDHTNSREHTVLGSDGYITDLERQVRDLKAEVEFLRKTQVCTSCGAHNHGSDEYQGILNRPRGTFGGGTRTLFGGERGT